MSTRSLSTERFRILQAELEMVGIFEKDLRESFVTSQGKGGQNVNKVATCVCLQHVPTGITVKCQKERAQALNRFLARRLLLEKIKALRVRVQEEKIQAREKLRRKNRRRPRGLKEKILEGKRKQSEKKKDRQKMKSWV